MRRLRVKRSRKPIGTPVNADMVQPWGIAHRWLRDRRRRIRFRNRFHKPPVPVRSNAHIFAAWDWWREQMWPGGRAMLGS